MGGALVRPISVLAARCKPPIKVGIEARSFSGGHMVQKRDVPGIRPYDAPAGGWGALKATAIAIAKRDLAPQ